MKIKNTPSRNKIIRFADAFIEVPAKAQWLAISRYGMVFAAENAPYVNGAKNIMASSNEPMEWSSEARLVAHVEDFGGAQVIKIDDLMAGL